MAVETSKGERTHLNRKVHPLPPPPAQMPLWGAGRIEEERGEKTLKYHVFVPNCV